MIRKLTDGNKVALCNLRASVSEARWELDAQTCTLRIADGGCLLQNEGDTGVRSSDGVRAECHPPPSQPHQFVGNGSYGHYGGNPGTTPIPKQLNQNSVCFEEPLCEQRVTHSPLVGIKDMWNPKLNRKSVVTIGDEILKNHASAAQRARSRSAAAALLPE